MNKKSGFGIQKILLLIFMFFLMVLLVLFGIFMLRGGFEAFTRPPYAAPEFSAASGTPSGTETSAGSGPAAPLSGAETSAAPPVLDAGQTSREEADALARERAETPGVVISGRPRFTAAAGKETIEGINLVNDKENDGNFYLSYELRLPDAAGQSYEVLFRTDLIAPGNVIPDVTLSRPLEAGEYRCVLHAQPYKMDSMAPTNNADMDVILEVK